MVAGTAAGAMGLLAFAAYRTQGTSGDSCGPTIAETPPPSNESAQRATSGTSRVKCHAARDAFYECEDRGARLDPQPLRSRRSTRDDILVAMKGG